MKSKLLPARLNPRRANLTAGTAGLLVLFVAAASAPLPTGTALDAGTQDQGPQDQGQQIFLAYTTNNNGYIDTCG